MTIEPRFFPSRRGVLAGGLAAAALSRTGALFAAAPTEHRFVFIILRGGLDGLSAVVPVGDPAYADLRRATRISAGDSLALDNEFALHPALTGIHGLYQASDATLIHACATPYRDRSHFDGQDVLENGGTQALAIKDGWLNRALAGLPGASGLAVGQNLPLVLRGKADATTWAPSVLPDVDPDTINRLQRLYADDPILGPSFERAIATEALVGDGVLDNRAMGARRRGGPGFYGVAAEAAASLLRDPKGPRVAVLQFDGWDTHARQGGVQGQLAGRLRAMDQAVMTLKETLGPVWQKTVVLMATEFGRTAAENGTGGTDHGTAAAAVLLGGPVQGGRVIADWPGLGRTDLYEGRDLRPTLDLRSLLKGVLAEHLGLGTRLLEDQVFPSSREAPPLAGLVV